MFGSGISPTYLYVELNDRDWSCRFDNTWRFSRNARFFAPQWGQNGTIEVLYLKNSDFALKHSGLILSASARHSTHQTAFHKF